MIECYNELYNIRLYFETPDETPSILKEWFYAERIHSISLFYFFSKFSGVCAFKMQREAKGLEW